MFTEQLQSELCLENAQTRIFKKTKIFSQTGYGNVGENLPATPSRTNISGQFKPVHVLLSKLYPDFIQMKLE